MKELRKSRILITGVQGQVGFELAKSLSANGAELVLAARKAQGIDGLGYRTVALDLANDKNIQSVLREIKPDIVVNPAAYTAVDRAEDDREQAFKVNHKALAVMAEVLEGLGAAMIHFSTDYVYNPEHEGVNVEDGATNPGNVYAASKHAGERALAASGVPHVILRTSWVYGTSGNNFVKTMLRLGREREALRIVSDQIGSPTSAATLGQVVASILQQGFQDPIQFLKDKQGVYNVSDNGYTSWLEFAQEIFRQAHNLGVELKVKEVEGVKTQDYKTAASRPLNSKLSLDKIAKELRIFPPKWQQSLAIFLRQSHTRLF